jgi:hypothetical protein
MHALIYKRRYSEKILDATSCGFSQNAFSFFSAEDGIQGLIHARRALYQ